MRKSEIEAKFRRIAFEIKFVLEMMDKISGPAFKDVRLTMKKAGDLVQIALEQLKSVK